MDEELRAQVTKLIAVAVGCLLLGLGIGYVAWGQQNWDANAELNRVRRWLAEEMQRSDERSKELEARIKEMEAELRKAETAIKSTQGDSRPDPQQRRVPEERGANQTPEAPRRQPPAQAAPRREPAAQESPRREPPPREAAPREVPRRAPPPLELPPRELPPRPPATPRSQAAPIP